MITKKYIDSKIKSFKGLPRDKLLDEIEKIREEIESDSFNNSNNRRHLNNLKVYSTYLYLFTREITNECDVSKLSAKYEQTEKDLKNKKEEFKKLKYKIEILEGDVVIQKNLIQMLKMFG